MIEYTNIKKPLKKIALILAMIIVMPFILYDKLMQFFRARRTFHSIGCLLSIIPGMLGKYMRTAFYMKALTHISSDVNIGFGSFFSQRDVTIDDNVSIGSYCIIGKTWIKKNTVIASRVSITSGKKQHDKAIENDKRIENKSVYERIIIGERVWIGEGSIIMADIGDDTVIGAGSVVTKDIKKMSIAYGNPAKVRVDNT